VQVEQVEFESGNTEQEVRRWNRCRIGGRGENAVATGLMEALTM